MVRLLSKQVTSTSSHRYSTSSLRETRRTILSLKSRQISSPDATVQYHVSMKRTSLKYGRLLTV